MATKYKILSVYWKIIKVARARIGTVIKVPIIIRYFILKTERYKAVIIPVNTEIGA